MASGYNPDNNVAVKKGKCSRCTTFIVVVLLLAIAALVAYIVYDKIKDDDDNKERRNEEARRQEMEEKRRKIAEEFPGACTTNTCILTASSILEAMDDTVDPCDDFYEYACGNWKFNNPLSSKESHKSQLGDMADFTTAHTKLLLESPIKESEPKSFKDAKNLYKSCMDHGTIANKSINPLLDFIYELADWPAMFDLSMESPDPQPSATPTSAPTAAQQTTPTSTGTVQQTNAGYTQDSATGNFTSAPTITTDETSRNASEFIRPEEEWQQLRQIMIKLRDYGTSGLFTMFTYTKLDDPTKTTLVIQPPSIRVPRILLAESNYNHLLAYMHAITRRLGLSTEQGHSQMEKAVEIQYVLNMITNRASNYTYYSLDELKNNISSKFDWETFLRGELSAHGKTLDVDQKILIVDAHFFTQLFQYLESIPTDTIKNYLNWDYVLSALEYIDDDEISSIQSNLFRETDRVAWVECHKLVSGIYPLVVTRMFSDRENDNDYKEKVMDIGSNVRDEFIKMIKNVKWMGEVGKNNSVDKANAITFTIGNSDRMENNTVINKYYRDMPSDAGHFFKNVMQANKFQNYLYNFESYGKPTNKYEMGEKHTDPMVLNAYYNFLYNHITFTTAILNKNIYSSNNPDYMNYGGTAFVMGHEITHGFDNNGIQYNKNGVKEDMMSKESKEKYDNNTLCFIEHYNNQRIIKGSMNVTVDGEITLGENIADIGGIKTAYYAYKTGRTKKEKNLPGLDLTNEQMMFLGTANFFCGEFLPSVYSFLLTDSHTPNKQRINSLLQNSYEFNDVFKCSANSKMNKKNKCVMW